jgi:hypothetical protein
LKSQKSKQKLAHQSPPLHFIHPPPLNFAPIKQTVFLFTNSLWRVLVLFARRVFGKLVRIQS